MLSDLPIGEPAVVTALGGERSFRRRLMEMGLVPGTEIKVLRVAPMGDPLELEVRGTRLSIRHQEAGAIQVESA